MKFLVVLALFAMAMAEPEADPALIYTTNTLPLTSAVHHSPLVSSSVYQPFVYNSAVQTPLVYKTPVQTPLLKTVDNAVVPAVGGYIHSSHVGVCTNNLGIRVPC